MQPEDIDKLFRDQLREHAPAPPAYLWNQLEAELRPAKKRPTMWLYAAAAVVALLLVAGGSWLWQAPGTGTLEGTLATRPHTTTDKAAATAENSDKTSVAQATPAPGTPSNPTEANRAETMVAAVTPQASETAERPAAHRPAAVTRPRDETPVSRSVARLTVAPRTLRRPAPEQQPVSAQAFATATTARPERPVAPVNAPQVLPAPETATALAASPTGTIEVEVRRGIPAQAGALADAPEQPRLVGRLLRKAGTVALREARENLPRVEVPTVTLTVLNHSVSTKDIQF